MRLWLLRRPWLCCAFLVFAAGSILFYQPWRLPVAPKARKIVLTLRTQLPLLGPVAQTKIVYVPSLMTEQS